MSLEFSTTQQPQPAGSKQGFIPMSSEVKLAVAQGGDGAMKALASLRAVVVDANKKAQPWKNHVGHCAQEAMAARGLNIAQGPLRMEVAFEVPRPKGHFRVNGELSAEGLRHPHPAKKPDILKLVRGIEDALTGIVYKDDSQIVSQEATKLWSLDGEYHTRVVVRRYYTTEED